MESTPAASVGLLSFDCGHLLPELVVLLNAGSPQLLKPDL